MGCISSKTARSESSPPYDVVLSSSKSAKRRGDGGGGGGGGPSWASSSSSSSSSLLHAQSAFGPLEKIKEEPEKEVDEDEDGDDEEFARKRKGHLWNLRDLKRVSSSHKRAVFSIKFGRLTEGELVAAGWPAWLSAVAGEAIHGWLPLRSDAYERLEKIGQGTYSDVYRARHLETGKMVAVKKVRFDKFQPESVKFMAREILILRKLDHPNIMKLEGIITSQLLCSIYLVFEYMEHDLAGLLSCPDIKFTDSQIKCYMRQLLCGVEHCHSRGILHRDIKTSNILVNNEGILKIADFGLANFMRPKNKQPLTSRVVTLWYRPPELLLGSTRYSEAVDLWSVGCVFAELFVGRPLLKGRTEVEQLHKIFKLCGSPPDEYWKRSRLPLATMFKPQHPYESTLRERCKEFPKSAVGLIETLLSIEPHRRGTASSALDSKYFTTKPYACDPSSLPKYPPNKEIDAKFREEARRKKAGASRGQSGSRNPRRVRKSLQESTDFCKVIPSEENEANQVSRMRTHTGSSNVLYKRRGGISSRTSLKEAFETMSEASQMTEESQESTTKSVPVQASSSSSYTWAKRQKQQELLARAHGQYPQGMSRGHDTSDSDGQEHDESSYRAHGNEPPERVRWHHVDSFDSSNVYQSQELPLDNSSRKKKGRLAFSGPVMHQSEEAASRHYEQPRQVHHRSRFYNDL